MDLYDYCCRKRLRNGELESIILNPSVDFINSAQYGRQITPPAININNNNIR